MGIQQRHRKKQTKLGTISNTPGLTEMKMSEKEILPVILILTIHIDTVVLLDEETRIVAEDNYVSRLMQTPNSNDERTDKSPSRRTLKSNDSIVDMGRSTEPSSRAIFLRPPAQLTQEDLELIDKRVEIKVTFCGGNEIEHLAILYYKEEVLACDCF